MEIVHGDLIQLTLDGHFDVIVHGCNCHGSMDAGIAKAIRATWPAAYEADLATPRGDRNKLGTISAAEIATADGSWTVVNAYTQFDWQGDPPLADYDAIRRAFGVIRKRYTGRRIGYPRIGAGLAGGDWDVIAAIVDEELAGEHHTLVAFAG